MLNVTFNIVKIYVCIKRSFSYSFGRKILYLTIDQVFYFKTNKRRDTLLLYLSH